MPVRRGEFVIEPNHDLEWYGDVVIPRGYVVKWRPFVLRWYWRTRRPFRIKKEGA